jgi:ABC-type antimicrobial peptide transport system permease subunit
LSLSLVGVYCLLWQTVSEQTREIGVRLAMGARRSDIIRAVLIRGSIISLAGIVLGLLASFVITRFMKDLLFDISPTDPLTFTVVPLLVFSMSLMACLIPARRAASVDAVIVLRD